VWLGLSQLHTLHGVNLNKVSTAAIAAALPRLHTLHAFYKYNNDPKPLTGFFTDLLPRLRVLHFEGTWPVKTEESAVAVPAAPPPPLPFLEELVWQEASPQPAVLREFLGARPIVLHVPYALLAESLLGCGSESGEPRSSLLARVRELRALKFCGTASADFFGIARVLRAAPRLCVFGAEPYLRGDSSWLIKSTAPLPLSFVGLVHDRLRHLTAQFLIQMTMTAHCGCSKHASHGFESWRSTARRFSLSLLKDNLKKGLRRAFVVGGGSPR
jgi:hypothetical protein